MKKLLLLGALAATVAVSCGPPPPSSVGGTGCRALPASNASARWDGATPGVIEAFNGQTCEGPRTIRWQAIRVTHDGGAGSSEAGNAACLAFATPLLPPDLIQVVGPNMTIWYQDLVDGNEGDSTGIPRDLYACAVAYIDAQGTLSVWPDQ